MGAAVWLLQGPKCGEGVKGSLPLLAFFTLPLSKRKPAVKRGLSEGLNTLSMLAVGAELDVSLDNSHGRVRRCHHARGGTERDG